MNEVNKSFHQTVAKIMLPVMEKYNFHKNGLSYCYITNNNWGLVSFQKSSHPIPEGVRFTINLGVASDRLLKFFSFPTAIQKPKIEDCHWRVRLGELLKGEDQWWMIEIGRSTHDLVDFLYSSIENLAISEIQKFLDDVALRDLWLTGRAPSLTEFQRLLYLSILLKEVGPQDQLAITLSKLKQISEGKPSFIAAEIYIRKLIGQ
jgi:hypothetical protein